MFKNILLLVSGTALAQAIGLITIPILSRLYSPSDFGAYSIVLAIMVLITSFSTFRYEIAILIKQEIHPVSSLLFLILFLIITSSLILLPLFLIIVDYLGVTLLFEEKLMLSLLFILGGLNETCTVWHIRKDRFALITTGKLIQVIAMVSLQIIFAKIYGTLGLIYGYTIGSLLLSFYYLFHIISKDGKEIDSKKSLQYMKVAALTHRNFPIFSIWSSLLDHFSHQLPILLFGHFFSTSITGHYEMSRRLTLAPLSLVGQSIFRVVSGQIGALALEQEKAALLLDTVFLKMARYIIIPFVIGVFFLNNILGYVLGVQWTNTGLYAQAISPWLFMIFLSWPLTSAYNTFGYQAILIRFNLLFILAILIGFGCHLLFDLKPLYILIIISGLSSLARLWYCYWILKKCGVVSLESKFMTLFLYLCLIGLSAYLGGR